MERHGRFHTSLTKWIFMHLSTTKTEISMTVRTRKIISMAFFFFSFILLSFSCVKKTHLVKLQSSCWALRMDAQRQPDRGICMTVLMPAHACYDSHRIKQSLI